MIAPQEFAERPEGGFAFDTAFLALNRSRRPGSSMKRIPAFVNAAEFCLELAKIARVFVPLDHVASFIVNANHRIV